MKTIIIIIAGHCNTEKYKLADHNFITGGHSVELFNEYLPRLNELYYQLKSAKQ